MQAQDRIKLDQVRQEDEQPVLFIGHGNPMVAIEYDEWSELLCAFIEKYPMPVAIIVMSAHWETEDLISITSSEVPEQIYDFEGVPDTLYQLTYPCNGNPKLAEEVAERLRDIGIEIMLENERGLDHGTWVPLYVTFPNADVPVIQISIPKDADPKLVFDMGTALAPLRKKGILLIGSGNLVYNHDLSTKEDKYSQVSEWVVEADNWIDEAISSFDLKSIFGFKHAIPHSEKAIGSTSHFYPLFFVLGAMTQKDHYTTIYTGFHYSTISMRTFAFTKNR